MRTILHNLDKAPIGFFDSGVGGVTVFEQVKRLLPDENYIYFGDTKNMPYGEKTPEQLLEFADNIFKFFEKNNAKAVVMACNTTSAIVYEELKNNYNFEIFPIIQSVAKQLSELNLNRIGVFATPATINSHCYKMEIQKHNPHMDVVEIACPKWVKIVENGEEKTEFGKISVREKMIEMLDFAPEKIVLGCTHYPYLIDVLENFAPRNLFINPSVEFAKIIKNDLAEKNLLNKSGLNGSEKFYVSANPEKFKMAASMFYKISELPELALNNPCMTQFQ